MQKWRNWDDLGGVREEGVRGNFYKSIETYLHLPRDEIVYDSQWILNRSDEVDYHPTPNKKLWSILNSLYVQSFNLKKENSHSIFNPY